MEKNTIGIVTDGMLRFDVVCENSCTEYEDVIRYIRDDLRSKTDLEIEVIDVKSSDSEKHAIYIGKNYDDIFPNAEESLTYMGYAVIYHEGDIYLFGRAFGSTLNAAKKLLSSISVEDCITKDEKGLLNMVIPTSLMFVYNPRYSIEDPTLFSAHISEYKIVYAHGAEISVERMAILLSEKIGAMTGYAPMVVTDNEAAVEREIVLGTTNRNNTERLDNPYGYSIRGEQNKLYLNFGSVMAFDPILNNIQATFDKDTVNIVGEIDDRIHMKKDDTDIRIISYNVWSGIGSIGGIKLPNPIRAALSAKAISDFKPDFVGLQETKGEIGDEIIKNLTEEYTPISRLPKRWIFILYRHDDWKPVEENGEIVMKAQYLKGDTCWGYEWVLFEKIADPSVRVIMMNLHFRNGYYTTINDRPSDMYTFNTEVRRLEALYPDIPLMITGDYNTGVSYKRSRAGEIHDGWEEDIIVNTRIQCSSQLTEDTDDTGGHFIDHVCVSYDLVDVVRHRLITYEALTGASDHRPLLTDIKRKVVF